MTIQEIRVALGKCSYKFDATMSWHTLPTLPLLDVLVIGLLHDLHSKFDPLFPPLTLDTRITVTKELGDLDHDW